MKLAKLLAFFLLLLMGCQAPLVKTRNLTFESRFIVNGKPYDLKTDYTCHYEDLKWLSERGKDWHIRGGVSTVRIIGNLADGSLFEVLPRPPYSDFSFCPDKTQTIDANIFIKLNDSQVESFNKNSITSANNTIKLLDARLSYSKSGVDKFVEVKNWPKQPNPAQHFYSVQATIYNSTSWKNRPEIVDLIRSKKIVWLKPGLTYPFSGWTNNDIEFARLRQYDKNINGYDDPANRIPLVPNGDSWLFVNPSRDAVQWRIEPLPSSQSEEIGLVPSQKFKRWIVYGDSRIELPLRNYYRLFYEPEYDRLIEFRAEHVALW